MSKKSPRRNRNPRPPIQNKNDAAVNVSPSAEDKKPSAVGAQLRGHLFSQNPVFVKLLAIVPILAATTSLKNGVLVSASMVIMILLLNIIMYFLHRVIPHRLLWAVEVLISGIIVTPICVGVQNLVPNVTALVGIYLPLLAVVSPALVCRKYYGTQNGFTRTLIKSCLDAAGFAFAAIVISVLREVFGAGTLYDRPLRYIERIRLQILLAPTGGFLLFGCACALFRRPAHKRKGAR